MKLVDFIENRTSRIPYNSLTKQLRNSNAFESQKNILKTFYKDQAFTRTELIRRMRKLERGFKYDSAWYGEQYVGVVLAFFLGGFFDSLKDKHIVSIIILTVLFFGFAGLFLIKNLRKYIKIENRLYEINFLELELIKTILVRNDQDVDVEVLIEQIPLDKLYFNQR